MSADPDEDRPSREVAYRLFAAEFDDADVSYSESDEERAPNYVVTPTGARVNRMFAVGVLTSVEQVNEDVARARVVDPTGAFVVYAGQYQPDALAALERAETPSFVAVTGKARTFEPDDADRVYTSIRPESVNAVDAETRDRWVVTTAEHTLARVAAFADAIGRPERGDDLREALEADGVEPGLASGIPIALDHYGTTPTYLDAVRELALDAVRVVAGEREEVGSLDVTPDEEGTADAEALAASAGAGPGTAADSGTEPGDAAGEEARGGTADESGADGAAADGADPTTPADEGTPEESGASADDASAATTGTVGDFDAEGTTETEAATADEPATEPGEAADAEVPETDEMYEVSEEEREAVEEEFGVEFSSGTDIPDAGESDIEAPASDAESETDASVDAEAETETAAGAEAETESGAASADEASGVDETNEADSSEDLDLEDAAVERMRALGGGGGVDRDDLVAAVSETRGVEEAEVEEAIQEALMSGRCYESGENELTPI